MSFHRRFNAGSAKEKRDIIFQGYIYKRGQFNTDYKKRWFILYSDNTLLYFEHKPSSSSDSCSGEINLYNVTEIQKHDQTVFHLITSKRTFELKCADVIQLNKWFNKIKSIVSPNIILEDWLYKKHPTNKHWKLRYFVLCQFETQHEIRYYEDDKMFKYKGNIQCNHIEKINILSNKSIKQYGKDRALELVTQNRIYVVAATDSKSKNIWYKTLQKLLFPESDSTQQNPIYINVGPSLSVDKMLELKQMQQIDDEKEEEIVNYDTYEINIEDNEQSVSRKITDTVNSSFILLDYTPSSVRFPMVSVETEREESNKSNSSADIKDNSMPKLDINTMVYTKTANEITAFKGFQKTDYGTVGNHKETVSRNIEKKKPKLCTNPFMKVNNLCLIVSIFVPFIIGFLYYFMTGYDDICYLLAGIFGLLTTLNNLKSFCFVLSLKNKIGDYHTKNMRFKKEHRSIQTSIESLNIATESLQNTHLRISKNNLRIKENLYKFKTFQLTLSKLNTDNFDGVTNIGRKIKILSKRYYDNVLQKERDILTTIFERLEIKSPKNGITREGFNEFIKMLPNDCQNKFKQLGTFEKLCELSGIHKNYIDCRDFQAVLDVYANMQIEMFEK
eukprot:510415_1